MSANGKNGWNRSTGNQPMKRNTKAPAQWKGIAAGLAVVVPVIALCLWLFSGGDDAPKTKPDKERGRIKEVTPAPAPKAATRGAVKEMKTERPYWADDPRVVNGIVALPPWKRKGPVVTNGLNRVRSFEEAVFTEPSDRLICSALLTEPGSSIVGEDDGSMFAGFTELFLKSLKTPIVDLPEDSDHVKDAKQAIREMREDFKKRYDAGEDLDKLMTESRKELRELGLYRDELNKEIDRLLEDGDKFTAKDLKDLEDAANLMLDERGAKHLEIPEFLYRRAEMRAKERQRDRLESGNAETEEANQQQEVN